MNSSSLEFRHPLPAVLPVDRLPPIPASLPVGGDGGDFVLCSSRKRTNAMAVPKRRTSHARQGKRRSHLHVKRKQNTYCNNCNNPILPHHVCWHCGWHNTQGREAVAIEEEEES